MILRVDRLEVAYGAVKALRGVSVAVAEGEVVSVIGANGAGKSTMLRTMSGLVPAARGKNPAGRAGHHAAAEPSPRRARI